LLQSLILLFEKRFGGELYRPIGTEWHTRGYWKVYDHPATVEQFLGIGAATPDGTPRLNDVVYNPHAQTDGVYLCHDIDSGETNKAITYEEFMNTKFDIVIASMPCHIQPFKKLCREHPNHPKLIFQIGNAWTIEAGMAPNIMASAIINDVPKDINFISYHQEFDTNIFAPSEEVPGNVISSFVNCFNTESHLIGDWQLFQKVEALMPEWKFKSHGGQCRDGAVGPSTVLARAMLESRFIWHTKQGGDGYGHIIHNVGAIGRPLIVKRMYYDGKMGAQLMIDGETCINIDGLSIESIIQKINYYNEPARYKQLCINSYNNFKRIVDFDREFENMKKFIQNLL
jgi:hypothetical protein